MADLFENPLIVFPVGPPASGKSTIGSVFTQSAGRDRSNAVVSPDFYREVMCGTRSNQTMNHRVFEICNLIAMGRMESKLDVWFDATNMNSPSIRELSLWAKVYEVEVVSVLMTAPDQVCRVRNRARAQQGNEVVPEDIMDAFLEKRRLVKTSLLPGTVMTDKEFLAEVAVVCPTCGVARPEDETVCSDGFHFGV